MIDELNRVGRHTVAGSTVLQGRLARIPSEIGPIQGFHISEIKERGYKLDVTWLKDDSLENADELPEPQDLAAEAITELEAVVDDLREIVALVEKDEAVEK